MEDNKALVDGFYFLIKGYGRGVPLKGVVYTHPMYPDRDILAVADGRGMKQNQMPSIEVKVYRDKDNFKPSDFT